MKNDILIDAIGMIKEETVKDAKEYAKKPRTPSAVKITALVAAVIFCLTASIPAFAAADFEPAYQLLYTVSPEIAQKLKPIKKSCVSNGIQMEVASALIYGDTAEIYIAMKDLTGNRIDKTIDLFDSYNINVPHDLSGTCAFDSFDEETGVATFLITMKQMNKKDIKGSKITFSVSNFLSHKKEFKGEISNIDLSKTDVSPKTKAPTYVYSHGTPEKFVFLEPLSSPLCIPADGVAITAMGYVGDKLHIQLRCENTLKTDNHGWLLLEDSEGNSVESNGYESFWDKERVDRYDEYVFDVPYSELGKYKLFGEFVTCDQFTEGDWQITFPVSMAK